MFFSLHLLPQHETVITHKAKFQTDTVSTLSWHVFCFFQNHAHASTYTNLAPVCIVFFLISIQQPRQAEVGDLDVIGWLHQHVPGCQVPVDQPPLLQVHHPLSEWEEKKKTGQLWILPWSHLSFQISWSDQSETVDAVNVSTNIKLLS